MPTLDIPRLSSLAFLQGNNGTVAGGFTRIGKVRHFELQNCKENHLIFYVFFEGGSQKFTPDKFFCSLPLFLAGNLYKFGRVICSFGTFPENLTYTSHPTPGRNGAMFCPTAQWWREVSRMGFLHLCHLACLQRLRFFFPWQTRGGRVDLKMVGGWCV